MSRANNNSPQKLRPGDRIFLVVSLDMRSDTVDARKSVVLEQRPDMLVVGQPDPALPKTMVGKTLEVAVFPPAPPSATACVLPLGYDAKILEIFPSYSGGKGRPVPAVGLTPPRGAWHQAIIRMHVRAQVRPEHGLGVEVSGAKKAVILDLSGGGALLGVGGLRLSPGKNLRFDLLFPDGGCMPLESEVRWAIANPNAEDCMLVGVHFKRLSVTESRYLARLAQQILSPCENALKSPGKQKTLPWPTTFRSHG